MVPAFLTIAGSDCSAGAGLQADLKTGYALGCYPLTAVTCVVSEAPGCVAGIHPIDPSFVASQIKICLQNYPVAAAKTGILYSSATVRAVAAALPQGLPLVVDPIIIATAGTQLMADPLDTLAAYEQTLFPRATLITPNRDELCRLIGARSITTPAELSAAAAALAARHHTAVLAKGGHLPGHECTDALALPTGATRLWTHPRTPDLPTHGTGCTLSAAITAHLAHGASLEQAITHALHYTATAIAHSHHWNNTHALNHHCQA